MKSIRIITTLILIGALAGCGGGGKTDSKAQKQAQLEKLKKEAADIQIKVRKLEDELKDTSAENIKLVTADTLAAKPFKHFLEIQGKIDADQNISLSAKVPGAVTAIHVQEGDQVRKGQVLAELDNLVTIQGMEEVKSQLAFAQNLYDKQKTLWDKKIGSEVQFLTAKNNKEALEKKLATLNEQLDMSKIKSPIDGVVDEVAARIGQNAAPGVPAFRVVNLNNLKVKADVPESFSDKVRQGDEAMIYIPDLTREIPTKLSFVARVINNTTRTFYVETKLESKPEFRPNMTAILKIVDYKSDKAMTVPLNVVQKAGQTNYVMLAVPESGHYVSRRVNVTTGQTYAGLTEITHGLKSGDRVITNGYQDLNDGDVIRF